MFKMMSRLLDRIFGVLGAFCFAQVPQFLDIYKERLSGHLAEITIQVQQLQEAAKASGKDMQGYINGFLQSSDISYSQQGKVMEETLIRWNSLQEAMVSLQDATPMTRPIAFLSHVQGDIVKGVIEQFHPGLSFTIEAGVYALVGIVLGTGVFFLIRRTIAAFGRFFGRSAGRVFGRSTKLPPSSQK